MKTPMMDIRMRVIGVRRRQRTIKAHNIDVAVNLPYEDVDLNQYVSQALNIRDAEMRTVESCELYLSPWTEVREDGYPHAMKEVRFGDSRYRKIKL